MAIHEVRYMPGPEDRAWTVMNGIRFKAGEWVEVDTENRAHCIETPVPHHFSDAMGNEFTRTRLEYHPISDRLKDNPFFEVREKGGRAVPVEKKKNTQSIDTAEAYEAYAVKWINASTSSDEMKMRWRREQAMRDNVGAADEVAERIFAHFSTKLEMIEMTEE